MTGMGIPSDDEEVCQGCGNPWNGEGLYCLTCRLPKCPLCGGFGQVERDDIHDWVNCPKCKGQGRVSG